MLKMARSRARLKRARTDLVDDADVLGTDLHLLHYQSKDLDLSLQVGVLQARLHRAGEAAELPQQLVDVPPTAGPLRGRRSLHLKRLHPVPRLAQARLELRLVDQPLLVGVD